MVVWFREIVEGGIIKMGSLRGRGIISEKSWSEWIVAGEVKLCVQGNKYTYLGKCEKLKDYFWKIGEGRGGEGEWIYMVIIRKRNVFDFLI